MSPIFTYIYIYMSVCVASRGITIYIYIYIYTRGYTALSGTAQNSARTPGVNENKGFITDPKN